MNCDGYCFYIPWSLCERYSQLNVLYLIQIIKAVCKKIKAAELTVPTICPQDSVQGMEDAIDQTQEDQSADGCEYIRKLLVPSRSVCTCILSRLHSMAKIC